MILTGKNVIITGATSGLGVDMAAALSSEGATVFIGGRREDQGVHVAKKTNTTFHVVDVADERSNQAFFKAAESHFGGNKVDYIFLNAGVEGNGEEMVASTLNIKTYDYVFSVNVRGVLLGLRYGIPLLRKEGTFVLTSSIVSILAMSKNPIYAASKATVDSLARSYAAQFAESEDEITKTLSIVTINPTVYSTEMAGRFTGGNDEVLKGFATMMSPSKRVGKGSELASTMVQLVRGTLPYKSGDSFVVDVDTHLPLQDYFDRMKAVSA